MIIYKYAIVRSHPRRGLRWNVPLVLRRSFRILSKTGIQESQGNCTNRGSHRVPFTQLYIQLAPLYTITFPHRLDGLEEGLLRSSFSWRRPSASRGFANCRSCCLCLVQGLLLGSLHALRLDVPRCFWQVLADAHKGRARGNGSALVLWTRDSMATCSAGGAVWVGSVREEEDCPVADLIVAITDRTEDGRNVTSGRRRSGEFSSRRLSWSAVRRSNGVCGS